MTEDTGCVTRTDVAGNEISFGADEVRGEVAAPDGTRSVVTATHPDGPAALDCRACGLHVDCLLTGAGPEHDSRLCGHMTAFLVAVAPTTLMAQFATSYAARCVHPTCPWCGQSFDEVKLYAPRGNPAVSAICEECVDQLHGKIHRAEAPA